MIILWSKYFLTIYFMYNSKCCSDFMCILHTVVVIGALNWLLVGLAGFFGGGANWDVVQLVLGGTSYGPAIVYTIIGVAGILDVIGWIMHKCEMCAKCKE